MRQANEAQEDYCPWVTMRTMTRKLTNLAVCPRRAAARRRPRRQQQKLARPASFRRAGHGSVGHLQHGRHAFRHLRHQPRRPGLQLPEQRLGRPDAGRVLRGGRNHRRRVVCERELLCRDVVIPS